MLLLARTARSDNEALQHAVGCALAPFYLDGGFNKGETFVQEPIKCLLAAAVAGKTRLHREIPAHEVELQTTIFESPLCKVYRGSWAGHSVAIKKFSQYSLGFSWEDFYKEVGLLTLAQHPNVVKLHGAFANDGKTEEPFIVLEYLAKGDLHDVVVEQFRQDPVGFPYARLVAMVIDIAKGLAYLHQLGIIHRDISA